MSHAPGPQRPPAHGPLLVTRAAEDQAALAEAFAKLGWRSWPLPLLSFETGSEAQAFARAYGTEPGGWLLLTSARALGAVQRARARAGADADRRWKLACVGESTAKAAREGGLVVAATGPGTGAQALFRQLLSEWSRSEGGRVLWPTSDRARATLAEPAQSAGWQLERFEVYRTLSQPAAAAGLAAALEARPQAVVLWSPSALEAWLQSLREAPPHLRLQAELLDLLVPGETTAQACRVAVGLSRLRGRLLVAKDPTPAGLVAALPSSPHSLD